MPESPDLTLAGGIALLLVTLVAAVARRAAPGDLLRSGRRPVLPVRVRGFPPAPITTLFVVAPAVAGWVLHRRGLLRPVAPV